MEPWQISLCVLACGFAVLAVALWPENKHFEIQRKESAKLKLKYPKK